MALTKDGMADMSWFIATIIIITLIAFIFWGPIVSNVEQAKYTVIEKHDNIEVRDYAPMIVAEIEIFGDRESAINQGFRSIADYIFGNNTAARKVAMTAPVIQHATEKISMTAPVTQIKQGESWIVKFVMPASYTMQTLPKPNNKAIKLKETVMMRYVVIRFSGLASMQNLEKNTSKLKKFTNEKHLKIISEPVYAFFNPPFTLPFMRRNEVMFQVEKQ